MTGEPLISLREITDKNRDAVLALRVAPEQERFVATVSKSLNDAATSPDSNPWCRAIYAGDEPVGFLMLCWDVTPQAGMMGQWCLWRVLIDQRYQRHGYGTTALQEVVRVIRAAGAHELRTSYVPGEGSPWPFYERLGFVPTGELEEDELVIVLDLDRSAAGGAPS